MYAVGIGTPGPSALASTVPQGLAAPHFSRFTGGPASDVVVGELVPVAPSVPVMSVAEDPSSGPQAQSMSMSKRESESERLIPTG